MEKKKTHKTKQTLTRFNKIYSNPKDMLFSYLNGDLTLKTILNNCIKGKTPPEFRAIIYRMFLNNLPYNEPAQWVNYLDDARNNYYSLLKNIVDSNNQVIPFINCSAPKGHVDYEKFRQYFSVYDFDLLALIKIDVDRTFQELDLFRHPAIKAMQCKILYVYSKNNSDPSYCQGMNEILGTLLYALLPSLNFGRTLQKPKDKEGYFDYITSDDHFEADLFSLFEEIMSRDLKELYTYNDERFKNVRNAPFDKENVTLESIEESEESELIKRIKKIYYVYLKQLDEEYFKFLINEIEPNIFLLRWILCMLNREYSLNNAIWLWDCILGYEFVEYTVNEVEIDKSRLTFLDCLCLSMILSVKESCMTTDDPNVILSNFMKFPNERKIQDIIFKAVELSSKINGNVDLWEDKKLNSVIIF